MTNHKPDSFRVLQITTSLSIDGVEFPNAILKCRKCKVDAEGTNIDGQYVTILCPSCGVRVDGENVHAMYLDQSQYLLAKELRKAMAAEFGSSRYFNYEPGDEPFEPDWPFFLELEV